MQCTVLNCISEYYTHNVFSKRCRLMLITLIFYKTYQKLHGECTAVEWIKDELNIGVVPIIIGTKSNKLTAIEIKEIYTAVLYTSRAWRNGKLLSVSCAELNNYVVYFLSGNVEGRTVRNSRSKHQRVDRWFIYSFVAKVSLSVFVLVVGRIIPCNWLARVITEQPVQRFYWPENALIGQNLYNEAT